MPAASSARLRFGRGSRLKQGRDFARLRQQGERLTQGCLIANWAPVGGESVSRLGVVTSRKVGNAVARGRARRLLRESFRRHQHELIQPVDLVLVARPSIGGKRCGEVERDLLSALRRARLLKRGAVSPA
jgi:ribonuclease P protein component